MGNDSPWSELRAQQKGNGDIVKVDTGVAHGCAKACSDMIRELRGYQKIINTEHIETMERLSPLFSGLNLTEAFKKKSRDLNDKLDQHIKALTDLGDLFKTAGLAYANQDADSKAKFKETIPRLGQVDTAPSGNDIKYSAPDYNKNKTSTMPAEKPTMPASIKDTEPIDVGLEAPKSMMGPQLVSLRESSKPEAAFRAGAVWKTLSERLVGESYKLEQHLQKVTVDNWRSPGADKAVGAVQRYGAVVQQLAMRMQVVGNYLTYTSQWLSATVSAMPYSHQGLSESQLNEYRDKYRDTYARGMTDTTQAFPVLPDPNYDLTPKQPPGQQPGQQQPGQQQPGQQQPGQQQPGQQQPGQQQPGQQQPAQQQPAKQQQQPTGGGPGGPGPGGPGPKAGVPAGQTTQDPSKLVEAVSKQQVKPEVEPKPASEEKSGPKEDKDPQKPGTGDGKPSTLPAAASSGQDMIGPLTNALSSGVQALSTGIQGAVEAATQMHAAELAAAQQQQLQIPDGQQPGEHDGQPGDADDKDKDDKDDKDKDEKDKDEKDGKDKEEETNPLLRLFPRAELPSIPTMSGVPQPLAAAFPFGPGEPGNGAPQAPWAAGVPNAFASGTPGALGIPGIGDGSVPEAAVRAASTAEVPQASTAAGGEFAAELGLPELRLPQTDNPVTET
ncbi:hypothetical protein GCM10023319_24340 [Nocardia iowensis]